MKTKLVYVLTCPPEGNYIEQAVLATFSARYHNPSAHIVLIVDNKTDELISSGRNEVLKYISEKIVVPFEEDKTMMYRSRWIKTSVRTLIDGDFLFIDCDTITTRCLDEIDSFECIMGAVPDSHAPIKNYIESVYNNVKSYASYLAINLEKETYFFNSGVCYVKDLPETHDLYRLWHQYWHECQNKGILIDQPALLKADIESGHIITKIDDRFNCLSFTEPDFANHSTILHFLSYRNKSWLFSHRVLGIIKEEGIQEWIVPYIIKPISTYIPFRYSISRMSISELLRGIKTIARGANDYSKNVDASFSDMNPNNRWLGKAKKHFIKHNYFIAGFLCLFPAWFSLRLKRSNKPAPNICAR